MRPPPHPVSFFSAKSYFYAAAASLLIASQANAVIETPAIYNNPLQENQNAGLAGADPAVVDGLDGYYYMFVTKGWSARRLRSADMVNWDVDYYRSDGQPAGPGDEYGFKGDDKYKGWAPTVWHDGNQWVWYSVKGFSTSDDIRQRFGKDGTGLGFDPMYFGDVDGETIMYTGGTFQIPQLKVLEPNDPSEVNHSKTTAFYYQPSYFGTIFEGPWVHEHNGTYYLITSIFNAETPAYRLAYATADNPRGPWTWATEDEDDAFLRASWSENIWGPGHHCMIADSNGTQWVYYQQKENTDSNWDREIAMDPLWIDASGRMHMRPTRGKDRPGPDSALEEIWPIVDAQSQIEAESYDGSGYIERVSGGSSKVVDFKNPGGMVAYRNIDFGTGMNGFSVNLSCEAGGAPASLEIRLGGVKEPIVGTLSVAETAGYQTLTGKFNQTVSGVHDVIITGQGAVMNDTPFLLDHFTFTASGSGSVTLPPICLDDQVSCSTDGTVVVSVLGNDTDPEAGSLTLVSVGSAEKQGTRSFLQRAQAPLNLEIVGNTVVYTPPSDYWGEDSFFYTVVDDEGLYGRGKVFVNVEPSTARTEVFENGMVTIEAEDYYEQHLEEDAEVAGVSSELSFTTETTRPGFIGDGYVVTPDVGQDTPGKPCRLTYVVDMPKAEEGNYRVWLRVLSPKSSSNRSGISLTRRPMKYELEEQNRLYLSDNDVSGEWVWVRHSQTLSLAKGLYKLSLWRNEDGQCIDRILLTDDTGYNPNDVNSGYGPMRAGMNYPPVAIANGDQTLVDADNGGSEFGQFDGSASYDTDGTVTGYNWFKGGILLGTGPNPSLNLSQGTHKIQLIVEDDQGSKGGAFTSVTVLPWVDPDTNLNKPFEAESYDSKSGSVSVSNSGTGQKLDNIRDGDWVLYEDFDFGVGASSLEITMASKTPGGLADFRLGSLAGTSIGIASVGKTQDWENFETVKVNLDPIPTGVHDLYIQFIQRDGETHNELFNIDWFQFKQQPIYGGSHRVDASPTVEFVDGQFSVVFARDESSTVMPQVSFDLSQPWLSGDAYIEEVELGVSGEHHFYRAISLAPASDEPVQFMRVVEQP